VNIGTPRTSCSATVNLDCVATCDSSNTLTADKIAYIKKMVDLAVVRLTQALQVDPVVGNLALPLLTQGCGSDLFGRASVSSVYLSPGVPDADYVIFITGRPTLGSNVAYALDCAVDAKRRPIAGHFNWGPNQVDSTKFDSQLGVALHELSHALGFSRSKFTQFYTANQVLQDGASTTGNGATLATTFMVTPNVVREVRDHFGCSLMGGAVLEDQGGTGTAGSHWEKRLFMNEYITGTASDHPIFSRITLAAFEDSGWYKANYSAADPLIWGRKQGCSFALSGCTPTNWKGLGYYCSAVQEPGCAPDRRAVGICGVITQTNPIPNPYKYFQDPTLGGFEMLADYCPYVQGLPEGDCLNTLNEGKDADAALLGTSFGTSSRCFPTTLSLETISNVPQAKTKYGCYRTAAVKDSNNVVTLHVKIGKLWWPCEQAGEITALTFKGTLVCPDPADFVNINSEDIVTDFPAIDGIVPQRGPASGGTRITVFGANFNDADASKYNVVLGESECRAIKIISPTQLECVTPKFQLPIFTTSLKVAAYVTNANGVTLFVPDAFTFAPSATLKVSSPLVAFALLLLCLLVTL
jgi:leishmanolysin